MAQGNPHERLLPDCPIHGRSGHPAMPAAALPPGPASEEALLGALRGFRLRTPPKNPNVPARSMYPLSAEQLAREEEKARLQARAVWLTYCTDPFPTTHELMAAMGITAPNEVTKLRREGLFRLRSVLDPGGASSPLVGEGTRLAWALYGCGSPTPR